MICDHVQQHLLDESAPRVEGHQAHLEGCAECQAFRRSHAAALRLVHQTPVAPSRVDRPAVQRRVSILAALALVVVGSSGLSYQLLRAGLSTPAPVAAAAPEPEPEPEPEPDEAEAAADWASLVALGESVRSTYTTGDPLVTDASYQAFGELPTWLAPGTTRPLHGLHRVLTPLVPVTED